MNYAVWKYPLPDKINPLTMPLEARPLSLQMQDGVPTLWALVDTSTGMVERTYCFYDTGETLPGGPKNSMFWRYAGTLQFPNGTVYHLFDVTGLEADDE